jgi:flavin reductase (DIM6/NTAB) family NADH-FMN oxidoreductase RutF
MADRIGRHLSGGHEPEGERAERERKERLREALSYWATGVTILAVREGEDGPVHALTVSAFMPLSIDPPLILVSLGANAAALPYLEEDGRFTISMLSSDQKSLASRYADTFPVGPSPFPATGAPRVSGSVAALVCEVDEMLVRGDHTVVVGRIVEASASDAESALAYFRRNYHTIGG